jgi:hypothetical protein
MQDESTPRPGARVACRMDLPGSPDGRLPAIKEGTTGHLVRLIHSRIEGEPFPGRHEMNGDTDIVAHVRWDGTSDVVPLSPSFLRTVPPGTEPVNGPIDVEILELVDELKRRLSKRNMRFVADALMRELGQNEPGAAPPH